MPLSKISSVVSGVRKERRCLWKFSSVTIGLDESRLIVCIYYNLGKSTEEARREALVQITYSGIRRGGFATL